MEEKAEARLREILGKMPYPASILLFTDEKRNEPFNRAAREVLRVLQRVFPRVQVKEYDLGHEQAREWKVQNSPTLLFDPEHYKIRWLGAPIGEETKTLIIALQMLGYRSTGLSDDSRKIMQKITSPRHIKVFVSPTCPYCPQQAVNALNAALAKPDLISLEIIDIQVNPDLARKYGAQSVPQVFVDEKLIARGAQPEELFMSSLEKMEEQRIYIPESDASELETDLVIVGGGPAGLTAGIYAARSGLNAVIVEKGVLGGQVATTPVVENYPGITQVGGKALVDVMVEHALQYSRIFPGEEVMEIQPGDPILVVTNRRRFKTKAVLLATGARYRNLGAPGEARFSGRGVSYCSTCDGPLFSGKKVLIVGGGDSAVTEALNLLNIDVDVTLVHRRERLRAQEHLVKSLEAKKTPILFNTEVQEIRGDQQVREVVLLNSKTGEKKTLRVDGVFVAIGYDPEVSLAKKVGVELTPDGYIKHDSRHRTNIPGIYAAGDVEGGYKQIVIAAGKGSEAALTIFEDLINPYWKKAV
ncbi:MAG: FAD-dependent oxidoreductase [Syntrophaceae bacterium]|nr:FAD-dependent oxidoreductase [Syntrophaceae bacterium]